MLNRQKLLSFITGLGNLVFNITWIKKDGTIRNANVRRKVTKYLCGGGKAPSDRHSFVAVYLMPKMTGQTFLHESGYRLLNLSTVQNITVNGKTYEVTPDPILETVDLSFTTIEQPENLIALSNELQTAKA